MHAATLARDALEWQKTLNILLSVDLSRHFRKFKLLFAATALRLSWHLAPVNIRSNRRVSVHKLLTVSSLSRVTLLYLHCHARQNHSFFDK